MVPVRHLNLQEYQSKQLMSQFGINVQKFKTAESADEAGRAAKELGRFVFKKKLTVVIPLELYLISI